MGVLRRRLLRKKLKMLLKKHGKTRQSEADEDEEESQSQLPQSRIFLHQDPWRFYVRLRGATESPARWCFLVVAMWASRGLVWLAWVLFKPTCTGVGPLESVVPGAWLCGGTTYNQRSQK